MIYRIEYDCIEDRRSSDLVGDDQPLQHTLSKVSDTVSSRQLALLTVYLGQRGVGLSISLDAWNSLPGSDHCICTSSTVTDSVVPELTLHRFFLRAVGNMLSRYRPKSGFSSPRFLQSLLCINHHHHRDMGRGHWTGGRQATNSSNTHLPKEESETTDERCAKSQETDSA